MPSTIIHLPRRFMPDILPPVTPESIARAKAAAEREREEISQVAALRDECKQELSRMLDLFGAEIVRQWVNNWEAIVSPSTISDPWR